MSETVSALVQAPNRDGRVPALYVGLSGDSPRSPPARIGLANTDRVDLGRGDGQRAVRSSVDGVESITMTLADGRMSTKHARLSRIGAEWALEDVGSKNGTWLGGERVVRRILVDGDTIILGHTAIVFRTVGGEQPDLERAPSVDHGLATLSPALAHMFADLTRVASSTVAIEISGETGTGKELVARAVHARSGRPGEFVAVNCGALAGSLLEAELFGHKKGAFTGAGLERIGLVRSADGGTLFLDEVAELPAASQTALLRVLQEREVMPIGADRAVAVDLRVVTATHKSLDAEVNAGRFRADLRARMLGFSIEVPALRERREDLGMLVTSLLAELAPDREIVFSAEAVAALYRHGWPLNVRELERALAVALAVARDRIEVEHLPAAVRVSAGPDGGTSRDDHALRESLVGAIARHEGNVAAVARELGKDPTQVRRWMKRFGLSRGDAAD